jgi:hypothetical protein
MICVVCLLAFAGAHAAESTSLERDFGAPPDSAKPWVYWYFMDGNLDRAGMKADLEAMKQAGIGGAIFLEVNIGVPRGPVDFMSPQWLDLVADAVREADQLNIQIALAAGPGWCGTGGPWITPDLAMQDLVASTTNVTGPVLFSAVLPQPLPREPFFGENTLTPELKKEWRNFYHDTAVLAFRTPNGTNRIADVDEKALYYRAPFSSQPGVKPFLPELEKFPTLPANACIQPADVVDLTRLVSSDGQLHWNVPSGQWTIMRFGRALTGQTTRPAPKPGLGFESDKFDRAALDAHFAAYVQKLLARIGPRRNAGGGLTMLHFDSWEMSSQNWSPNFYAEFLKRRGYDPLKFLPALTGRIVGSPEISERFLWDLRRTAQELVVENHVGYLQQLAHKNRLTLSVEPYDLNPAGDLTLGRVADVPQCEFWNLGFDTDYSVIEAASIAHTCGRNVAAAEAFTSEPGEDWWACPATLKAQGDWAFCAGVNRFDFHRFQAQPWTNRWPGMAMGPYGVHWDRTQTWWDMVPSYHEYLSRCQFLLQQGTAVADVCFLAGEDAPYVFRPPDSATIGSPPDHGGYNFDGCAPETLLERAFVKDGNIIFPGGTSYRVLVLPEQRMMTPALLHKIKSLVHDGATVFGPPPEKSPSLQDYPNCDATIQKLARQLWGDCDGKTVFSNAFGKGRVVWEQTEVKPLAEYGDFAAVTNLLEKMGVVPDFTSTGPIRFTHRRDGDTDIYFLANREPRAVEACCQFRVTGRQPELWNPETGEISSLPMYEQMNTGISVPLRFEQNGSCFVVFRPHENQFDPVITFTRDGESAIPLTGSPFISGQDPDAISLVAALPGTSRTAEVHCGPAGQLKIIVSQAGRYELKTASGKTFHVEFSAVPPPQEIAGPWDVSFPPNWGAPEQVTLAHLISLSDSTNAGVKFFSGTATYAKNFDWNADLKTGKQESEVWLDLGDVQVMADVKLNGRELGILWHPPFRVDITQALKAGRNSLEVRVANLWPNRMIGDAALPAAERFTWSSYMPFAKDSPLPKSGLLGPVVIQTALSSELP